jgi:hypothetical protein
MTTGGGCLACLDDAKEFSWTAELDPAIFAPFISQKHFPAVCVFCITTSNVLNLRLRSLTLPIHPTVDINTVNLQYVRSPSLDLLSLSVALFNAIRHSLFICVGGCCRMGALAVPLCTGEAARVFGAPPTHSKPDPTLHGLPDGAAQLPPGSRRPPPPACPPHKLAP